MALLGMPSYFAVSGSWTITIPPSPLMALTPRVPSDGFFTLIFGKRFEKEINGHVESVFYRVHQMKALVENGYVLARWIQVDMVRFYLLAVYYLFHVHPGVFVQKRCHNAFVLRAQMLDDHEGHVAVGRHDGKKSLESF